MRRIRGQTPSRNFRLSNQAIEKLDALVHHNTRIGLPGWCSGVTTRTDVIRYLIFKAFDDMEKAARDSLDADLNGSRKKPRKRSQTPLPTRKGK